MAARESHQVSDIRGQIEKMDALIRSGKGEEARKELSLLLKRKIPRSLWLPIARLSRRTNLPHVSVRLLNPAVRGSPMLPADADEAEKAEYAASLTLIGAAEEALTILKGVESDKVPESLLFQAFAYFAEWDYGKPIPLLQSYLKAQRLTDYQRLVGMVNLAAALVYERKEDEATGVLQDLLTRTEREKLFLLQASVLEIAAQNAIQNGRWAKAASYLDDADELITYAQGREKLFIHKWRSILRLYKEGPRVDEVRGVLDVRAEAKRKHAWEVVRDCDRALAVRAADTTLAQRVYFGTPYASYRQRMMADMKEKLVLPEKYLWRLRGESRNVPVLTLLSGAIEDGKGQIELGSLTHRLMGTLSRDFYRPLRLAEIHFHLYPKEFFNPRTSPARIYEAVKRVRQWLESSGLPLGIQRSTAGYQLNASAPVGIEIPLESVPKDTNTRRWAALKGKFGRQQFSAHEAAACLNISARTALRLLVLGESSKMVERTGSAATVRYFFPDA